MKYVQDIMSIPDVNGDFPLHVRVDHGCVEIQSQGTFLDETTLGVLRATLKTAETVAAVMRAEMARDAQ